MDNKLQELKAKVYDLIRLKEQATLSINQLAEEINKIESQSKKET